MADKKALFHEKEQSLNFLSASFDPLKALYTKDLKPPLPSIQVFNNLGEYARVIKEGRPKTAAKKQPRKTPTLANKRTRNLKPEYKPPDISTRLKVIASTRVAQRDLLSSEKRVGISGQDDGGFSKKQKENTLGFGRGQTRKKRYMNVLEKMDACATGPLSVLYKCLDKRYKVQVWIRKYKGLRSVLTGYVIAFDKHMNLALMDVDEVYTTEEHLRNECSTEEETATKKKKKKKKKRRTKTQINKSLIDSDKEENISAGITPLLDKIHGKSVAGSKENPRPRLNEGTTVDKTDKKSVTESNDISLSPSNRDTTEQNVEAGLTQNVDLNRPFKSFESDYSRKETGMQSKEDTELATWKGGTSSPLVMAKESDRTEMLSVEQLAVLSKQWEDQHEQETKQTSDSQQEIEAVDLTEQPMEKGSEQTGYLFSHDLKVRVPAYEDIESQDMEFTVVGIFQPASTVESNLDKSVMLPDNLEINVPLSFSNSIDKKEVIQDHTVKLDKSVIPDELVLHDADKTKELNADSSQADNPVLAVSEPCDSDNRLGIQLDKPVLQDTSADGDLENKVMSIDKPNLPVSEYNLHGINTDADLETQAIKLDKPGVLVSDTDGQEHGQDTDEEAKDKIVQCDNVAAPTENSAENLSANTPATDEKSLICEGSSKEGEPLHVGNFSDGICTDEHKVEALPAASCDMDKNSIISDRNTKEREVSQDISTSNPENPCIESFKLGKFGINEEEMRSEKVLKESYAGVEFQEESTCLPEGSKSTEQKETEGSLMEEEEGENKNHEKCHTSSENENILDDNGMKYKEESENIGNMNWEIHGVDLEEGEIEQKDSKTLTDLMALREQNASEDNEKAALIRDKKDAVKELVVQDKPFKGHKEASQRKSLSGEDKTVAESVDKGRRLEESSLCKSLSADGTNNPARDDWLLTQSKESMSGKPILEEKSEDGRSQLDGNDKRFEDTGKNTQSSVGKTSEGVIKGAQKAEEENAMESEKEEGEITSSDEEELDQSIQSQVDLPKHVDTNNQQKKLSVWERLGFKDRDKEDSARRGSRENYDKKRREEKKQGPGRNKDDEKRTKDGRQSTSRDNKQKEQSGRKKEGKEKRDLKTKECRGSNGSAKTVRSDKVTGMKRTDKENTSGVSDLITGREMHSGRKGKKDDSKKKEQSGAHHVAKTKAEKPSHDTDHTRQSRKDKEDSVDEKAREGRSSSHEKVGQRKEGRRPSRVMPRSDIPAPHSEKEETSRKGRQTKSSSTEMKKNEVKKRGKLSEDEKHPRESKGEKPDRGKVDKGMKTENKKEERKERTMKPQGEHYSENSSRNMPHGTKARRESIDRKERKGSAATSTRQLEPHCKHDSEKSSRNMPHGTKARRESIDRKERKGSAATLTRQLEPHCEHYSEKSSRNMPHGTKARRESIDRKERKGSAVSSTKTSDPQGDHDSEKGSRNTRHDMQARRESIDKKYKKESGAAAISTRKPKPQGDQPKHLHSLDGKQLILKEFSINHHNAKEIPKGEKTGKTSKPEHHLTAPKKPRNPKREGSEQVEEKTVMSKTSDQPQEAQYHEGKRLPNKRSDQNTRVSKAQEAQSEESSTGSELMKAKSGKGVEELKKTNANTLGTSEWDTSSERTSAGENLKPQEIPKTEKNEIKPKKLGLLPTPVLEINTRTTGVGMWSGSYPRINRQSTIGTCNTSSQWIRNKMQVQKSPETCKKRKIPIGNGMGGRVKRCKRTDASEESISKSSNQLKQFKDSRKKNKSNSEPEVKSPKNTTKSESRALKKDIGGKGGETNGTPRQIKLGKGKFLEFKRRHVNQLFVRGDNIVMIGYAI